MNRTDAPPPTLLENAALFLDFDGTLVELADAPDLIQVPLHLPALLSRLSARLERRLAILSGRSIHDLDRHLECRGLAVSGSHGLELRLGGGLQVPLAGAKGVAEAIVKTRAFGASLPGLLVEEKPLGVALHFRQAAEAKADAEAFMTALGAATGLSVQHGNMVVELRPRGADKGDALRALMAEPEFAGARPVFVGDDLTDEDGFQAAAAFGGAGVLVGPARPTAATYRLDDVAAVSAWLTAFAGQPG